MWSSTGSCPHTGRTMPTCSNTSRRGRSSGRFSSSRRPRRCSPRAAPTTIATRSIQRSIDRLNDYCRLAAAWRSWRTAGSRNPIPTNGCGRSRSTSPAPGRRTAAIASSLPARSTFSARRPSELLRQADFDLDALEELAIDPRAFDFLHPGREPAELPVRALGSVADRRARPVPADGRATGHARRDPLVAGAAAVTGTARRSHRGRTAPGIVGRARGRDAHGQRSFRPRPGGRFRPGCRSPNSCPGSPATATSSTAGCSRRLPPDHRQRLEDGDPPAAPALRRRAAAHQRDARRPAGEPGGERGPRGGVRAAWPGRGGRAAGGAVPAASARMFARITSRVVRGAAGAAASGPMREAAEALDELDAATDLLFRAVGLRCGGRPLEHPRPLRPVSAPRTGGREPARSAGRRPRLGDGLDPRRLRRRLAARQPRRPAPAAAARAAAALERLGDLVGSVRDHDRFGRAAPLGPRVLDSAREVIEALERRRATAPDAAPAGLLAAARWRASRRRGRHAQAADALLDEGDLDGAMGLLVHWASLLEGAAVERRRPGLARGGDAVDGAGVRRPHPAGPLAGPPLPRTRRGQHRGP